MDDDDLVDDEEDEDGGEGASTYRRDTSTVYNENQPSAPITISLGPV
jgi:hypothetical protein